MICRILENGKNQFKQEGFLGEIKKSLGGKKQKHNRAMAFKAAGDAPWRLTKNNL